MRDIADFVDYVAPFVPGCPEPVIRRAIVEGAIQFCQDTWYYRETEQAAQIKASDTVTGDFLNDYPDTITVNGATVYPIATVGATQYTVAGRTDLRPYQVVDIWADSTALSPVTGDIVSEHPQWDTWEGSPQYYTRPTDRPTQIFPVPKTPPTLTVMVAWMPTVAATTLPTVFFTDFRQLIVNAALQKLHLYPDTSYFDGAKAQFHAMQYRKDMALARVRLHRDNTRGVVRAHPMRWV